MGGIDYIHGDPFNDVWYSTDGRNWTAATHSAEWSPRYGHASVSYNGEIWVIGGNDGSKDLNDFWSSADGTSWTFRTWGGASSDYAAVVHDGFVWLIGHRSVGAFSDTQSFIATNQAPWPERFGHTVVSCAGRMWLIGGGQRDFSGVPWGMRDVWSSYNGADWTFVGWAPFAPRFDHTSVVHNGKLWVLGGAPHPSLPLNDIWYSELPHEAAAARWTRYR